MPGVLTTVGASKVSAAKAANKKVVIAKIALGSTDAVASANTTTIGAEDKVQNRVHIVKGINGDSVSFSGMIELDSVSRRRLVGVYDSDGDLIAVERITIPIASDTVKHYILSVSLINYADSGIFDNSISYTSSFMSRQEAARIHRQSVDQVRVGMPSAQEGQLIRHTGVGREGGWILEEAMIVDNENDLALARNTIIPMSEVFNTWYRFSHGGGNPPTYPRLPAELDGWRMVGDVLESTINSSSYIGFISPNKVLDYNFEVTISSTSGDDDTGGLVIAFNIENGIEHCLSILRSPGGNPHNYFLVYNRSQFNEVVINNANRLLKWGNGGYGATIVEAGDKDNSGNLRWSTVGSTRVRVEREGDIVRVWASEWGTSELLPESLISFNMGDYPSLTPLRKPASYGYINYSQPNMRYETHEMTQPSQTILDLRDGKFYTYQNGGWVVQSTISGNSGSLFKPNRFIYSPINKRTYFTNAAGIPFRVI